MDTNVLVAAINSGGSVVIGVRALILADSGINSIERRLDVLEGDLKQFYRTQSEQATDIARLKDKSGLS